ncbi:hypothetical protein [Pedobacter nyackensis]|uniref:hypothetical protein n=1 Tax=Pedobacter nyackensis TaxID=475255 RepID=UPI0029303D33|nr:hypothetical protein [Pedobacter nyackensis]
MKRTILSAILLLTISFIGLSANAQLPPKPTYINMDSADCPEYFFGTDLFSGVRYTWRFYKRPSGPETVITNKPSNTRLIFTEGSGTYRIGVNTYNANGVSELYFEDFEITCDMSSNIISMKALKKPKIKEKSLAKTTSEVLN